jgi:hypothetical protein
MGEEQLSSNTVVFVSGHPRGREYKLAAGLQRLGWDVVLLYHNTPIFNDLCYFSQAIPIHACSLEQIATLIDDIAPRICHVFTYYDYDIPSMLLSRGCKFPVILDPYDLISGMFTDEFFAKNNFSQQLAMEKYCLHQAAGICCRHLETQVFTGGSEIRKKERVLVLDGCMPLKANKTEPKRLEDIHVVHSGSIVVEKLHPDRNEGFLWIVKKLLDSGLNFHLYPPMTFYNDFEADFSDYRELERASGGRFALHQPVSFDGLTRELLQYDVGIVSGTPTKGEILKFRTSHKMKYLMGNKIFDYIDAGLPIIANDSFKYLTHCTKKHGISLAPDDLLYSDKPTFDLQKFHQARSHVASAQAAYHFHVQTERLHLFYQRIIAKVTGSGAGLKTATMLDQSANVAQQAPPSATDLSMGQAIDAIQETLQRFPHEASILALETRGALGRHKAEQSTRQLSRALASKGRLVSLDRDPESIRAGRAVCREAGNVEWVLCDPQSYLKLGAGQQFHFVFLDSANDPDIIFAEFALVAPLMLENGTLVVNEAGVRTDKQGCDGSQARKGRRIWQFFLACDADYQVVETPGRQGTQIKLVFTPENKRLISEGLSRLSPG